MTSDASASEQRLRNQVQQGGFAVALSGGGHRATLAALGALLALVDRHLNRSVMQIASVSGGSITNAFVAQRCAFEELEPGDLDAIASELARTVVQYGVLTLPWLVATIAAPITIGTAVALFLVNAGLVAVVATAVGVIVAFGLLMSAGLVIEWLLDRRYFRLPSSGPARPWKPTLRRPRGDGAGLRVPQHANRTEEPEVLRPP